MSASSRTIRALAALAVFASVTALTTQASATISDPTIEQRMLVGTDIVIPIVASMEPTSEPKIHPIRVAPRCPECDDIFDDG